MDILEAAQTVLSEAGSPLHYAEVTQRAIDQGYWTPLGKTPHQSLNARLAVDIKDKGNKSVFQRTDKGVFALREWVLPEYALVHSEKTIGKANKSLSFTDAAERVLDLYADCTPMHYREIWALIESKHLVQSEGLTPEATLSSQMLTETARRQRRGDIPRFVAFGKGHFGLFKWQATGIARDIERRNVKVKKELLGRLKTMPPDEFEALVEQLLLALGFEDTETTRYQGDRGIDVRGTLVVGDVIKTRMAVQAKRWKNNVQSDHVQQVRGSLGAHEHGLIVTTADFSAGARAEATRADTAPIGLMNGEQFVNLLVENGIGVHKAQYELIELGEWDTDDGVTE